MFFSQFVVVEQMPGKQHAYTLIYNKSGDLVTLYKEHQNLGPLERAFGGTGTHLKFVMHITPLCFDALIQKVSTPGTL